MIRPAGFRGNPDTAASNRFQRIATQPECVDPQSAAELEFMSLTTALRAAGVRVFEFQDSPEPHKPDALFPNNWVSFHADGTVVLYPLLAENRRIERRRDILDALSHEHGFHIQRIIDLSEREKQGRYLEGTGSLVLDRLNGVAYACLSPRTDLELLKEFARQLDYEPIAFTATDASGVPIYHTNVLMCLGEHFAAICTAAIDPADRPKVIGRLESTGRQIIDLSPKQVSNFAGNMLELAGERGRILALSAGALAALSPQQLEIFDSLALRRVAVPLPTIERLGGGSARCMIADIHLPVHADGIENRVAVCSVAG